MNLHLNENNLLDQSFTATATGQITSITIVVTVDSSAGTHFKIHHH